AGRTRYAALCSRACSSSASSCDRSISSTRAAGASTRAWRRIASPVSVLTSSMNRPPERRGLFATGFVAGPPAPRAVLDGRRTARLRLRRGRQRRDAHLAHVALRPIDPDRPGGRPRFRRGFAFFRVALLVALRATAQAPGGIEI